jgi:hypothetical protein
VQERIDHLIAAFRVFIELAFTGMVMNLLLLFAAVSQSSVAATVQILNLPRVLRVRIRHS